MLNDLYAHLSRQAHWYLWLLVAVAIFGRFYAITLNLSDSLPGTVFLIQKGVHPEQGDLVAFHYNGGRPYERGTLFLKHLVGLPGAVVHSTDAAPGYKDYWLDGRFVGRAKPYSKHGLRLAPGPEGRIPPGHYYVEAPHPDSLDSRYALMGWVSEEEIVGKAVRVF
jgi:conjugal transfer pilin signal peptidase TrbI